MKCPWHMSATEPGRMSPSKYYACGFHLGDGDMEMAMLFLCYRRRLDSRHCPQKSCLLTDARWSWKNLDQAL